MERLISFNASSSSPSSSPQSGSPRPLLEESRRRIDAIQPSDDSEKHCGDKGELEAAAREGEADEAAVASIVERVVREDGAKVGMMGELRALRSREAALRTELNN
eukprot:scaffold20325_cov37-Prasinocladus_malaysianus.AAC.1